MQAVNIEWETEWDEWPGKRPAVVDPRNAVRTTKGFAYKCHIEDFRGSEHSLSFLQTFEITAECDCGLDNQETLGMFVSSNTVPDILNSSQPSVRFEASNVSFAQISGLMQIASMQGLATEVQLFSYKKIDGSNHELTSSVFCFQDGMEATEIRQNYSLDRFHADMPNTFSVESEEKKTGVDLLPEWGGEPHNGYTYRVWQCWYRTG